MNKQISGIADFVWNLFDAFESSDIGHLNRTYDQADVIRAAIWRMLHLGLEPMTIDVPRYLFPLVHFYLVCSTSKVEIPLDLFRFAAGGAHQFHVWSAGNRHVWGVH